MKKWLCIFLAFVAHKTQSQILIGQTKLQCVTTMSAYAKSNGLKSFFLEEQNKLTFKISRNELPYFTHVVNFDSLGSCVSQKSTFVCDTCAYYAYQKVLKNKNLHWKKIATDVYASSANGGLLLDQPSGEILTYRIRKRL
jgi:hypothetical protein